MPECDTDGCISVAVTRLVILDPGGSPTGVNGIRREVCVGCANDLNRVLGPVYFDGSPAYRWEQIRGRQ